VLLLAHTETHLIRSNPGADPKGAGLRIETAHAPRIKEGIVMAAGNEDTVYTQDGIMAQIWVAFGQGTGLTRVSQMAVMALHERYFGHIDKCGILPVWKDHAVQVLERIRTIGKFAALKALERGDTTISKDDVTAAIAAVERDSDSSWCPP
jgi:hypothetical protein